MKSFNTRSCFSLLVFHCAVFGAILDDTPDRIPRETVSDIGVSHPSSSLSRCESPKATILKATTAGDVIGIPDRYPYVASLQYRDDDKQYHRCLASLLAPDLLLTAAHCVFLPGSNNITNSLYDHATIIAGAKEWPSYHQFPGHMTPLQMATVKKSPVRGRSPQNSDATSDDDSATLIVESVVLHPNFTKQNNGAPHANYAIIKLYGSVDSEDDGASFYSFIQLNSNPKLPNQNKIDSLYTFKYGTNSSDRRSPILDPIPLQYDAECQSMAHENLSKLGTMCAKDAKVVNSSIDGIVNDGSNVTGENTHYHSTKLDTCGGVLGGPLFIRGDNHTRDVQVGLVSSGSGCNHCIYPGIYARISHQYQWIRDQICLYSTFPPSTYKCSSNINSSNSFSKAPSNHKLKIKFHPPSSSCVHYGLLLQSVNDDTVYYHNHYHYSGGQIEFYYPIGHFPTDALYQYEVNVTLNTSYRIVILNALGQTDIDTFLSIKWGNYTLVSYSPSTSSLPISSHQSSSSSITNQTDDINPKYSVEKRFFIPSIDFVSNKRKEINLSRSHMKTTTKHYINIPSKNIINLPTYSPTYSPSITPTNNPIHVSTIPIYRPVNIAKNRCGKAFLNGKFPLYTSVNTAAKVPNNAKKDEHIQTDNSKNDIANHMDGILLLTNQNFTLNQDYVNLMGYPFYIPRRIYIRQQSFVCISDFIQISPMIDVIENSTTNNQTDEINIDATDNTTASIPGALANNAIIATMSVDDSYAYAFSGSIVGGTKMHGLWITNKSRADMIGMKITGGDNGSGLYVDGGSKVAIRGGLFRGGRTRKAPSNSIGYSLVAQSAGTEVHVHGGTFIGNWHIASNAMVAIYGCHVSVGADHIYAQFAEGSWLNVTYVTIDNGRIVPLVTSCHDLGNMDDKSIVSNNKMSNVGNTNMNDPSPKAIEVSKSNLSANHTTSLITHPSRLSLTSSLLSSRLLYPEAINNITAALNDTILLSDQSIHVLDASFANSNGYVNISVQVFIDMASFVHISTIVHPDRSLDGITAVLVTGASYIMTNEGTIIQGGYATRVLPHTDHDNNDHNDNTNNRLRQSPGHGLVVTNSSSADLMSGTTIIGGRCNQLNSSAGSALLVREASRVNIWGGHYVGGVNTQTKVHTGYSLYVESPNTHVRVHGGLFDGHWYIGEDATIIVYGCDITYNRGGRMTAKWKDGSQVDVVVEYGEPGGRRGNLQFREDCNFMNTMDTIELGIPTNNDDASVATNSPSNSTLLSTTYSNNQLEPSSSSFPNLELIGPITTSNIRMIIHGIATLPNHELWAMVTSFHIHQYHLITEGRISNVETKIAVSKVTSSTASDDDNNIVFSFNQKVAIVTYTQVTTYKAYNKDETAIEEIILQPFLKRNDQDHYIRRLQSSTSGFEDVVSVFVQILDPVASTNEPVKAEKLSTFLVLGTVLGMTFLCCCILCTRLRQSVRERNKSLCDHHIDDIEIVTGRGHLCGCCWKLGNLYLMMSDEKGRRGETDFDDDDAEHQTLRQNYLAPSKTNNDFNAPQNRKNTSQCSLESNSYHPRITISPQDENEYSQLIRNTFNGTSKTRVISKASMGSSIVTAPVKRHHQTPVTQLGSEILDLKVPPGALGLILDSPDSGWPIIHSVKAFSCLLADGDDHDDFVQVGDRIVTIDGRDIRTLTSKEMSVIMHDNHDHIRRLTVFRGGMMPSSLALICVQNIRGEF